MAVTADVDIANLALARLGQDAITSLDNSSRDSKICYRFFDQNRDYCLSLYNWISVTEKIHMTRAAKTLISSASAASPVVLGMTGHSFLTGDLVTVEGALGMTELNYGRFVVYSYTSIAITLYNTDGTVTDGTTYTAYTSSGYAYRDAGNNWDYVYDLPSACARVVNLLDEDFGTGGYEWERKKDLLYCNVEYAGVEYLHKDTTPSHYDTQLVELISARLAWLISPKITSDEALKREVYKDWLTVSAQARLLNAKGRQAIPQAENLWIRAR